jgi:protein-disulfide isomerase
VSATRPEVQLTVPVSADRDHIQGPDGAPVTLVEYGDYECPYCGAAYPIIKEIQAQMGERLQFVFRNFPITTSHPHAQEAAEAAEAADAQGHFWEMHDQLFEHQDHLRLDHLRSYARALGLDLKRFDYELADNLYTQKVRDDFMGGVRVGVNGTPTFFINGVRYDGAHNLESLLAAVRSAA